MVSRILVALLFFFIAGCTEAPKALLMEAASGVTAQASTAPKAALVLNFDGDLFERPVRIQSKEYSTTRWIDISGRALTLYEDGIPVIAIRNVFGNGELKLFYGSGETVGLDWRGLRIQGKSVIGQRQPAIVDAQTEADIIPTLNAILGAMREHGLIER